MMGNMTDNVVELSVTDDIDIDSIPKLKQLLNKELTGSEDTPETVTVKRVTAVELYDILLTSKYGKFDYIINKDKGQVLVYDPTLIRVIDINEFNNFLNINKANIINGNYVKAALDNKDKIVEKIKQLLTLSSFQLSNIITPRDGSPAIDDPEVIYKALINNLVYIQASSIITKIRKNLIINTNFIYTAYDQSGRRDKSKTTLVSVTAYCDKFVNSLLKYFCTNIKFDYSEDAKLFKDFIPLDMAVYGILYNKSEWQQFRKLYYKNEPANENEITVDRLYSSIINNNNEYGEIFLATDEKLSLSASQKTGSFAFYIKNKFDELGDKTNNGILTLDEYDAIDMDELVEKYNTFDSLCDNVLNKTLYDKINEKLLNSSAKISLLKDNWGNSAIKRSLLNNSSGTNNFNQEISENELWEFKYINNLCTADITADKEAMTNYLLSIIYTYPSDKIFNGFTSTYSPAIRNMLEYTRDVKLKTSLEDICFSDNLFEERLKEPSKISLSNRINNLVEKAKLYKKSTAVLAFSKIIKKKGTVTYSSVVLNDFTKVKEITPSMIKEIANVEESNDYCVFPTNTTGGSICVNKKVFKEGYIDYQYKFDVKPIAGQLYAIIFSHKTAKITFVFNSINNFYLLEDMMPEDDLLALKAQYIILGGK